MATGYIYAMLDGLGQTVYVGATTNPKRRCRHWHEVIQPGEDVVFEILEETTLSGMKAAEGYWIAKARSTGAPLRNRAAAGHAGYTQSESVKQRISQAKKGKSRPPHVIDAIRRSNTRRKMTAEHLAKLTASHAGRPLSPEVRAKISAHHIGHPVSQETREKISRTKKERNCGNHFCIANTS